MQTPLTRQPRLGGKGPEAGVQGGSWVPLGEMGLEDGGSRTGWTLLQ